MKRKVAFIIPSLKNGGAERVLSTLSLNLNKDIKQYILTWDKDNQDYEFNGEIVEIKTSNSTNILGNIFVFAKRIYMVKRLKKRLGIDVSISHLEGPNLVNILSKYKEKTVITVHNFQTEERKGLYGNIFRVLMKLFYNKADKIVAVSKLIKHDLVNSFKVKENLIDVLYNPFDIKKIQRLMLENIDSEYEKLFENPVIINVGRLNEQKAQDNLIKAFYLLKKKMSNAKLVILGKGPLESKLQKLIKKLELEGEVFLLGFNKNPFKFIYRSKVFALTSLYEGFPMCIPESMVCGVPVISVDCKSGPREIMDISSDINKSAQDIEMVEYGIITPNFKNDEKIDINESHELFATAMFNLLSNNEVLSKYSIKIKERANAFDVSIMIEKWENIIYS